MWLNDEFKCVAFLFGCYFSQVLRHFRNGLVDLMTDFFEVCYFYANFWLFLYFGVIVFDDYTDFYMDSVIVFVISLIFLRKFSKFVVKFLRKFSKFAENSADFPFIANVFTENS